MKLHSIVSFILMYCIVYIGVFCFDISYWSALGQHHWSLQCDSFHKRAKHYIWLEAFPVNHRNILYKVLVWWMIRLVVVILLPPLYRKCSGLCAWLVTLKTSPQFLCFSLTSGTDVTFCFFQQLEVSATEAINLWGQLSISSLSVLIIRHHSHYPSSMEALDRVPAGHWGPVGGEQRGRGSPSGPDTWCSSIALLCELKWRQSAAATGHRLLLLLPHVHWRGGGSGGDGSPLLSPHEHARPHDINPPLCLAHMTGSRCWTYLVCLLRGAARLLQLREEDMLSNVPRIVPAPTAPVRRRQVGFGRRSSRGLERSRLSPEKRVQGPPLCVCFFPLPPARTLFVASCCFEQLWEEEEEPRSVAAHRVWRRT